MKEENKGPEETTPRGRRGERLNANRPGMRTKVRFCFVSHGDLCGSME